VYSIIDSDVTGRTQHNRPWDEAIFILLAPRHSRNCVCASLRRRLGVVYNLVSMWGIPLHRSESLSTASIAFRSRTNQPSRATNLLLNLSSSLHRVADMDSRRRLGSSADTDILLVPRSRLVTVGDRSFPVTGPRTGNNILASIRSAPSLLSFKRQLKTCLFSRRYTGHCLSKASAVDLAVFFNLGHF